MLSTALGMMYPKFSHSEDSSTPTKVRMLWRSFNSPHQSQTTVLFVGVSEGQARGHTEGLCILEGNVHNVYVSSTLIFEVCVTAALGYVDNTISSLV